MKYKKIKNINSCCLFDISDKYGYILPRHYTGRARTFEEAKKLLDNLNRNGEYRPYKMIHVGNDINPVTLKKD